jgi:hypothetical protein
MRTYDQMYRHFHAVAKLPGTLFEALLCFTSARSCVEPAQLRKQRLL